MRKLSWYPIPYNRRFYQTEVASRAYYGQQEHLEELLRNGASPNASDEKTVVPLMAALLSGQTECARILSAHPDFTPQPTKELLDLLCEPPSAKDTPCHNLVAQVILGAEFDHYVDEPLPDLITLENILAAQNIVLLLRYLKFHPVGLRERKKIAGQFDWTFFETDSLGVVAFAEMLKRCPDLMKHHAVQLCFCALALSHPYDIPQELTEFMHLMPQKVVLTDGCASKWGGSGAMLSCWRVRFGSHPTPCLDHKNGFPDLTVTEEMADHFIRVCEIVGTPNSYQLSKLQRAVFIQCSPEMVLQQLQPGGILAEISRQQLLDEIYRRDSDSPRWTEILKALHQDRKD